MIDGKQFYEEAQSFYDDLVKWRRDLHQIPELGLDLPKTSEYVQRRLTEMGIPFTTIVNGSGVVGQIGDGGKCLMLRSDFDALPIKEESGEPFASTNGCMHACGHDLHAATLLAAARILKAHEAEIPGTVKLFFQPGEEGADGAKVALEEGILENPKVDAAFAMHVIGNVPLGVLVSGERPMAAAYNFRITVDGLGGHGSMPEHCIDPITAGVNIHLALQALVAREISPLTEVALTVGKFQAGSASNVIPQQAVLEGTMRVFDPEVEKFVVKRIGEVAEGVAKTYRCTAKIEVLHNCPAVFNDKEFMDECNAYAEQIFPEAPKYADMHGMGSEDFGSISQQCRANYMMIGAAPADGDPRYGQHNPHVRFNEQAIPMAAAIYASVAMNWLTDHQND